MLPHHLNETQQQVLDDDLSGAWSIICAPGDAYWPAMAEADATINTFWPAEAALPEGLRLFLVPGAGYDGVAFAALLERPLDSHARRYIFPLKEPTASAYCAPNR